MSTSTVPVKTAAEAGVERFADPDEEKVPDDEYFLRNFQSFKECL